MNQQLKKGVIELVILQLLNSQEYYGYEISQYINEYIKFKESSIYIILSRLEQNGYIDVRSGKSPNNNKTVKYYIANEKGKEYLKEAYEDWEKINNLVKKAKIKGENNG